MYLHLFIMMVLSNVDIKGYKLTKVTGVEYNAIPLTWKSKIIEQTNKHRRIINNINLEYTEYFFKTSDSEIVPVKCYTRIERISNVTAGTMCKSLESHQEICLECHYYSYDRKFIRYQDEVGKYIRMAIPPSGFVCMPREVAAGCDVEKIGRYVEMDVVW